MVVILNDHTIAVGMLLARMNVVVAKFFVGFSGTECSIFVPNSDESFLDSQLAQVLPEDAMIVRSWYYEAAMFRSAVLECQFKTHRVGVENMSYAISLQRQEYLCWETEMIIQTKLGWFEL